MMSFIVVLVAVLATFGNAFSIGSTRALRNANSLKMATISDTFQFRKPNRLSFGTLFKALAATGLDATLKGDGPFTG